MGVGSERPWYHLLGFYIAHEEKKADSGGAAAAPAVAPKGCLAVKVGAEGEEQRRFVVPVEYTNHPLFVSLLKMAEEKYGFEQDGAITLPCGVDHFARVRGIIDRDHHRHQVHLAGCFR